MGLVVISSAPIVIKERENFLYSPYEKEMQLWARYTHSIQFCCPIWKEDKKLLIAPISFELEPTIELKEFNINSFINMLRAIPTVIINSIRIIYAIKNADHIHLRCPGNMGLLGCVIQLFFPKKKKTAKYAGNWGPAAKQPLSYRFQKWILNNSFLTRNMQVMVYGNWQGTSKNILPFFTATYPEAKKERITKEFTPPFKALFVGGLTPGKDPLYALQLVHQLQQKGIDINMDFYGEGVQRKQLEQYIEKHKLQRSIVLKGNQPAEVIEQAYKAGHFLILPSKSEGWPKAVAEAMFWGCVPMATAVSCVPEMLGEGERGLLLTKNPEEDGRLLLNLLSNMETIKQQSLAAQQWSQQFTLEAFEEKIKGLIE